MVASRWTGRGSWAPKLECLAPAGRRRCDGVQAVVAAAVSGSCRRLSAACGQSIRWRSGRNPMIVVLAPRVGLERDLSSQRPTASDLAGD